MFWFISRIPYINLKQHYEMENAFQNNQINLCQNFPSNSMFQHWQQETQCLSRSVAILQDYALYHQILFHCLVFKEMLSFSIVVSMGSAVQLKRINLILEGTSLDICSRSKGILSEISFSYLDLICMSQLFMTTLMYDLILTSCILKACLKHSNERANLFHHHTL